MLFDVGRRKRSWNRVKVIVRSSWLIFALGGCTWSPFGTEKDHANTDKADAAPELEHCTLKLSACRNSCFKAGAGASCTNCCARNAKACDSGESYSFYSCPDEE